MSFELKCIFDDVKSISLKYNHTCNPQRLYEALFVTDIPGTIHKRRQELIFWLTFVVNEIAKQQELVDLTAVEIPASVFDIRLDSYEEYVDLDSLQCVTLDWAYRAAKEGKTMINRIDLREFPDIFEATLGFFRLTIYGVKRYFFVYIAEGLEPADIKYLKKFLRVESPTTTTMEIGITMNYCASNKEWKDMFIDGPPTSIPVLRPDTFNFPLQNPTTFKALNISKKELDEIRERQEYAFIKNR
ncbi:MAG: hypothetical protein WAM14_11610 [Candidatus Nitrosopolaris sp.]